MIKRWCKGFFAAVGMYSVLPVPQLQWDDAVTGLLIPCFPLVGALIGGLWWGAAALLRLVQPPALLAAVLLALVPFAASGWLHADGLMDTADAVCSRRPREEKLRILKDSHAGAFAVVSLAVVLLLAAGGADGVLRAGQLLSLLFIPVLSRCVCGLLILRMKLLFPEGYAVVYRQHTRPAHLVWLFALAVLCCAGGVWAGGLRTGAALAATLLGGAGAALVCRHELGGISGDVSGCILTVAELCGLLCAAVV